jgi:hypothetical protein
VLYDDGFIEQDGLTLYRIEQSDRMAPFLMTLVSSADHWLFVTSRGGLTAGRGSPETALFPYETSDRLDHAHSYTGPLTIIHVTRDGITERWEPFSATAAERHAITRNLYKDALNTLIVFEEVNADLGLTFRARWQTSPQYGFVRQCTLHETSGLPCQIRLLDGVQNVLPHGVTTQLQNNYSNLLDAYKRTEYDPSGLAIFALSSTLTDLAEASESLRATVAWHDGLVVAQTLLSTAQVAAFRHNAPVTPETDVRGERGAYLVTSSFALAAISSQSWYIVADVAQDAAQVADLAAALSTNRAALISALEADIAQGRADLVALVAAADGTQQSAVPMLGAHHATNTLFNIMRGGIFADGYTVDRADLDAFIAVRNLRLRERQAAFWAALPAQLTVHDLRARAAATGDADCIRLCTEYLPLTFSRRHGDPSRPWNRFNINVRGANGERIRDYQGNWRDLFQNWEPLGYAFPGYLEGIIALFLNATTADGYNPYRLTRAGLEWEVPEPENPWANIGYWSDHQIIYLLKLLEGLEAHAPGRLTTLLNQRCYSHANVPYRIKPYADLLRDPADSIVFDRDTDHAIMARLATEGSDAKLLQTADGQVLHVTLAEKLLLLALAKLVNFVPEGGIWMNTQRPEWNDANNALVGKGISVVTLAYLRRYLAFCRTLFAHGPTELPLSAELHTLFTTVHTVFAEHTATLTAACSDGERRALMDALGQAGDAYRQTVYTNGLSAAASRVAQADVLALIDLVLAALDHSLRANRRTDGLYHSYNLLRVEPGATQIGRLAEMLEGQVAILSAGVLTPAESLDVLRALRTSALYRPDQHSYLLYPNRELPGFRQQNRIAAAQVADLGLVAALHAAADRRLLVADRHGDYHFSGDLRNARDLHAALDTLANDPRFRDHVAHDRAAIADLFEQVFRHNEFTGRSGRFFGYEGLGSIYWHMVAKLLLAAQEVYLHAVATDADAALLGELAAAYHDIRAGLGFQKTPAAYGAFPTDPYSHTPLGRGAQQPGMTGQVKEELLTRMGELGVQIRNGQISFCPRLLDPQEWNPAAQVFRYVDHDGAPRQLQLPPDALAFTLCQTPVVYVRGNSAQISVRAADGSERVIAGTHLDGVSSQHLFARDGQIRQITVTVVDPRR